MARHLSTVEDVLVIDGRGLIVAPGILPGGDWRISIGDRITLEKPDGSRLEADIMGMNMFGARGPRCIPLLLGGELTRADVPIGTKLWVEE
jgi:hypothetical protein